MRKAIKKIKRIKKNFLLLRYRIKKFHEFSCIFIHIPKCAGISIEHALLGGIPACHRSIHGFRFFFRKKEIKQYFKFTIVRNPWDRVVSAYLFLKKGGRCQKDKEWSLMHLAHIGSFDEFIKTSLVKKEVLNEIHFRPQYQFITNSKGDVIMDYVGRFEKLEESFDYIIKRLKIEKAELKKMNVNKERRHYRSYYTDETREIVANLYKRDIKLLNYEF